jgi:hypothetical protein
VRVGEEMKQRKELEIKHNERKNMKEREKGTKY